MKKQIFTYYISELEGYIQYVYTPDFRLIMTMGNNLPNPNQGKLSKYSIEICLDKEKSVSETFECPICFTTEKTDADNRAVLSCKHEYCGHCINESLKHYCSKTTAPTCALCREQIKTITIKNADGLTDTGIIDNLKMMCVL
jgi:hypothetical protein